MFMTLIDAAFGPQGKLDMFLQKTVKFLVCAALAIATHLTADWLLNSYALPTDTTQEVGKETIDTIDPSGHVKELSELLSTKKNLLESGVFQIGICGVGKGFKVPCGTDDHPASNTLIGVFVAPPDDQDTDEEGSEEQSITYEHFKIVERRPTFGLPFAARTSVVHSVHTITREIETRAFNERDTPASNLKLCAGTRRLLAKNECRLSAQIESALHELLAPSFKRARWPALLLGPIQLLTVAIFYFILLESFGRKARFVQPSSTFMVRPTGGDDRQLKLKEPEDLDSAVDIFTKARVKSITDELISQAIVLSSPDAAPIAPPDHGPASPPDADPKGQVRTAVVGLEGYREYLVGEADARLDDLSTMNDTMMKLAFIGTVIGIALALGTARSLDAASPVAEMLTKAEMFGSIGAAFGTTMLGVALSIIASAVIQSLHSAWMDKVNDAFRIVLDLTREITPEMATRYASKFREPKPALPPPDPWKDIGTLLIVIFVIGGLFLAARWYW